MELLSSLSSLVKVTSIVTDLINGRQSRKVAFFEKQIEPLFLRFTAIHEDYLIQFTALREVFTNEDRPPPSLRQDVQRAKQRMEIERTIVGHLHRAVRHSYLSDIRSEKKNSKEGSLALSIFTFCESIARYLVTWTGEDGPMRGTRYAGFLDSLERFDRNEISLPAIRSDLEEVIRMLNHEYSRTARAYAVLRNEIYKIG